MQNLFQPIVHEYCYARSNVCCPAYMKKEVQIFPPAPVTTPSSFQTSVSSPLFCLFPVVLADQSIQHAILTQPDRTRFLFKTYMDAHPGPGCQGCLLEVPLHGWHWHPMPAIPLPGLRRPKPPLRGHPS